MYWKNIVLGGFFSWHHFIEMCIIIPHMPPFWEASFQYKTEVIFSINAHDVRESWFPN
jgi:hypothetical protein